MTPGAAFVASFAVTLILLGAVVVTGLRRKRRIHLVFVALALTGLGAAIFFAERLGDTLDLSSAGAITDIHLFLAKLATLSFALPLATGIRTWFRPSAKRAHFWCAMTALTLTVAAACTGTAMWLLSEPLP